MLSKENIIKTIYIFFVLTSIPLFIFYGGKKGLFLLSLFCAFLPLVLTIKDSFFFLELSFVFFALSPFYVGIDFGGRIPKIYLGEILFLFYFVYFVIIYFLFKMKDFYFQKEIFFIFFILIIFQSISFFNNPTDYDKIRNFFETIIFGIFLFIIFYNEITEKNYEKLINIIIFVTTIISICVLIEYFFKYNPILSFAQKLNFFYISPEITERLNAFYRPYAMFSSPSSLGTFLAMSLPFYFYNIKYKNKILYFILLIITVIAIILDYTRGVWVAIFLSIILYYKKLRKFLPFFLIIGIVIYYISYKFLNDYPFFNRLTNPKNFIIRLAYWKIALEILKENFIFGIGHLNFKNYYIYFIERFPFAFNFSFKEVCVSDNLFLTTIVEHGILGLFSILLLFFYLLKNLLQYSKKNFINERHSDFLKVCAFALTVYIFAGFFADVHLFYRATKYFFIVAGSGFAIIKIYNYKFDEE